MTSIAYYITGHGYGHAVRSNCVVQALGRAEPGLRIHVRSTAPQWLFSRSQAQVSYSRRMVDVGILQEDSLEMDLGKTLVACQTFHARALRLIEEEIRFIKTHDIRLILGDIPPIAFEIAFRASIPSVAITNFTWDWIYRTYLAAYPGFLPLIEEMKGFYQKATIGLTLPYPCGAEVFPFRESVPWVTRRSNLTKAQARAKLDLPKSKTLVLLSFGGLGLERLPKAKLGELRDCYFAMTGKTRRREGHCITLPDTQQPYEDLVRAADVIVTKPGYGIVADVLAHQTPILYTERGEFPEYPRLVQALNDLATAEFIPQSDLLSGAIAPYIERVLKKPANWPAVSLNGADVAAEKILALLDHSAR